METRFLCILSQISCTEDSVLFPKLVIPFNFFLQKLHRDDTSCWSVSFFAEFILNICSWAAHIRLSISCFNSLAFNQCHLFWSCTFSCTVYAMLFPSILLSFFLSLIPFLPVNRCLYLQFFIYSLQKPLVALDGITEKVRSSKFNKVFDAEKSSVSLSSWYVQPIIR